MGDLLGRVLFEAVLGTVFYATGKAVAQTFLPHLGIDPLIKQKSSAGWNWKGFTYSKGQRRYLYTESLQALGTFTWLFVGLAIWLFARFGV